jgi:hypothetical protein
METREMILFTMVLIFIVIYVVTISILTTANRIVIWNTNKPKRNGTYLVTINTGEIKLAEWKNGMWSDYSVVAWANRPTSYRATRLRQECRLCRYSQKTRRVTAIKFTRDNYNTIRTISGCEVKNFRILNNVAYCEITLKKTNGEPIMRTISEGEFIVFDKYNTPSENISIYTEKSFYSTFEA